MEKSSLTELLEHIENCRYLSAFEVYKVKVLPFLPSEDATLNEDTSTDEPYSYFKAHESLIKQAISRAEEVSYLITNEVDDANWILATTYFGVNTYYMRCEEDGAILLKMEGVMEDLPIFEQVAVIHETDLFTQWMPFCSQSKLIKKIGKAELYPYMSIGFPPLSRDFFLQAYGCDCLLEAGKIVIIGRSIKELAGVESPFQPKGWFHDQMEVKEFRAVVDILSPTSAKTSIFIHVDINSPLPQSLINFIMKNCAGVALYKFQSQVLHVQSNPDCECAQRIREDQVFYEDWVLPRLRMYCDLKGWTQPNVSSLQHISRISPVQVRDGDSVNVHSNREIGVNKEQSSILNDIDQEDTVWRDVN